MASQKISLLLADVDGTLVDSQKVVTPRAKEAIRRLRERKIEFAVTSGRPPRGMRMITEAIPMTAPVAAFNGGMIVRPNDMSQVIESHTLDGDTAQAVMARLDAAKLDVWVYAALNWYLRDPNAPHSDKEAKTVQFAPTVVKDFSQALSEGVSKIVGVSDDLDLVARMEREIQTEFGSAVGTQQSCPHRMTHPRAAAAPSVSAARSQPYYLDVTHPLANKGAAAEALSRLLQVPLAEIATIGDQPNDILMFRKSGVSIAMGQSIDEVKRAATHVSPGDLDHEGFARAVEEFLLG
jgi:Cof subfamily protein (haloacid dehalogenase superfamily)